MAHITVTKERNVRKSVEYEVIIGDLIKLGIIPDTYSVKEIIQVLNHSGPLGPRGHYTNLGETGSSNE